MKQEAICDTKRKENGTKAVGRTSLVGGALYLTMSAVFVKLLGLIYKIPLSHMLGDEGMGYFNAAYTVYGALYLLCTAGVPKAVSILTTSCDVRGGFHEKEKIFRVCLWSFGLLGGALTVLLSLFSTPLGHLIGSAPAAFCMTAIAPSLLFVAMGGVIRGYLNGHMQMRPIAVSQLIEGVCKLVFGLIFAKYAIARSFTLPLVSAFTILGITFGSFVSFLYLSCAAHKMRRRTPKSKDRSAATVRSILRQVVKVAAPITLSAAAMSLTNMLDLSLIMKRLTYAGLSESQATAMYGNYTTLVVPFFNLAAGLVASVATAILPYMTRLYAQQNTKEFSSLLRRTSEGCLCFILPFSFALVLFGKDVLTLLYKDESAVLATPMLTALAPAVIFMGLLCIVNTALEAAGHQQLPFISMLIGCAVKLLTGYMLLGDERFGILGAPIGTVLSYAVSLFVSLLFLYRTKGVRVSLIGCFFKPFVNAILAVCVTRMVYLFLEMRLSYMSALCICMIFGGVLYTFLSWITGALTFVLPNKQQKIVILDK